MDTKDYLTVPDAARSLGVAVTSVYQAIREERLPSERLLGRVVVSVRAVEEYRNRTQIDGEKPKGRPRKGDDAKPGE